MDNSSEDKSRYKLRLSTLQYDSSKAVAREIEIFRGQGYRNNLYPDNSINTNLYSYFFLIPYILFSQFKRIGYIWYLIITILQYIPYNLSPMINESTTIIFAISLFINLFHDIFANYFKRKSYYCVNSKDSLVWSESSKQFIHKRWEDIRVGFIVVVKNNEEVPADLILIATSDPEDSCFFETFNIDGSTRLSMRKPVSDFANIFESKDYEKAIYRIFKLDNAILKIDHPNDNYHSLYGSIKLVKYPKALPLTVDNFALRGSKLKNTEWVMGIVVYTGPDTKIMINSQELWIRSKTADKTMNKYIFWIFMIISVMVIILWILSITHAYNNENRYKYFTSLNPSSSWMDILSFLILFSYLIPINYYSIIDLIGIIQFWFMKQDLYFHDDKKSEKIISSNLRLNEDLGKVKYIFTDKTGTLTENKMDLKYFVIKGKSYEISELPILFSGKLYDTTLDLFKVLAICHTVSPLSTNEDIKYKGESLDEEALIMSAFMSGIEYKNTKDNIMELKIFGESKFYKLYGLNKFDPERKIMSIVVKELNCDKYPVLLCKGADDVLFKKSLNSEKYIKKLTKEIENHSKNGLRVLAIARKTLTEEEANQFEDQWIAAKNAMTNSELRLKEVANLYEKDLYIIGAVAIEDKIQDEVSDTVNILRKAGIKIWMMTGDRRETSISAAYASKLFDSETEIIQLSYSHERFLLDILEKEYNDRFLPQEASSIIIKSETVSLKESESKTSIELEQDCAFIKNNESYNYGMAVEGLSLDAILRNVKHLQYFWALGISAKAVIIYRITPAQKARIIKIFKENILSHPVTLAIGDGANDCAMLNEANIGVGILGKEGCQAAKCSDFAIANFKSLIPLLLVYGHWNCIRMSGIRRILIFSNSLLVSLLFYYSFISMYSASFLYESWTITIFYCILIFFPIVWLGVFDKDKDKEKLIKKPELYNKADFMSKENLWYIVFGVFQALLIFLLAILFITNNINSYGHTEDYFTIGCICFLIVFQVTLYELWFIAKSWTLLSFIISISSLLFAFSIVFLLDYEAINYYMKGTSTKVFSNSVNLIIIFTVPLICLVFRLSFLYLSILNRSQNSLRNKKIFKSTAFISSDNVQEDFKQMFDFTNYNTNWDKKAVILNYKMKPITMRFSNPYLENEFQADSVKEHRSSRRIYVLLSLVVFFIIFIINYLATNHDDEHLILEILEVVALLLIFLIFICLWFQQFEKYHAQLIISWIGLSLLFKIFIDYGIGYDMTLSSLLMSFCTFMATKNYSYHITVLNIANFIVYAVWMFKIEIKMFPLAVGILNSFVYLFLGSGMVFLNAMISYSYERDKKLQYLFIETVKFQYNKGVEILSNLFPHFIKDKVKNGEREIVLDQPDVTVMFCDIYQFDSICATHSPSELIDLLDAYFAILDKLCDDFGVAKIETVNKTFMTCAGIAQDEVLRPKTKLTKNHGIRTVELALAILDKLQHVYLKTGEKLRVKIGINTGPVIAGVVGLHKPQFSLVGDTVNTASRMMSTLKEPDSIQVSMSTYELIKDSPFEFTWNKIEAKGKGTLETYLVQKLNPAKLLHDKIYSHNNGSASDLDNSWIVNREAKKTEGFIARKNNRFYSVRGGEKCKKIIDMTSILDEMIKRSGMSKQELGLVEGIKLTRFRYKTEEEIQLRLRIIEKLELAIKYKIWGEVILILLATIVHLFGFIFTDEDDAMFVIFSIKIVILLLLIGVLAKYKTFHIKIFFSWILFAGFLSLGFLNAIAFYNSPKNCCVSITLEILFELQLIGSACFLPFANLLFSTLLLTIPTIFIICFNFDKEEALEIIIPFIFYCLLNLIALYSKEKQSRITFNLHKLMKSEISKTKRLLNQLIPPHAVRNMMNDLATTDRFNEVTMIFADICGFTDFSSKRYPEDVVSMLSGFFTIFDNLCLDHNVFKVHTIGDCYVIMSFRDAQSRKTERNLYEECENMLNMAFDMVKAIKEINEKNETNLNMRIGIHTGDLVGGITGNDIVRYDIYGPDVDIANKMESNGMPGKVNVSEVTKNLLEEGFPEKYGFEFNKIIIHKPINRAIKSYYASYNSSSSNR